MQPTPTRSPTRVLGDGGADLGDDAGDLVAGHQRVGCGPQSPRTVWMSEWQMPAYLISISTSCGADVAALDGGGDEGSVADGAA